MIILRQHNYSKEEEEQSKKKDDGKKIATKAAISVGGGLALAGGYQVAKDIQRNKAGKNLAKATEDLINISRRAGKKDRVEKAKDIYEKAKKAVEKKAKMSGIEKLGHKPENWVRSKITRKK
jgi:hypothetical protein